MNARNKIKDIELWMRVYHPRNRWMKKSTRNKIRNSKDLPHLTPKEVEEIVSIWGDYGKSEEYRIYKKYLKSGCKLASYVPWRYYLDKVDPFFCKSIEARALDNKNYYDLYFNGFKQPQTIARYMNGEYLDKDYNVISESSYLQLCKSEDKLIIKPAMMSNGGHGIVIWEKGMPDERLLDCVRGKESVIVQRFINQHQELSKLHKNSINTIRIITFFFEGEVHIITSFLRMGRDGASFDNSSLGGIFVGIKNNGWLDNIGFDMAGFEYTKHPQGVVFSEFLVPSYEKCVELVKKVAPRFANVAKIIPWDIAIGEDGEPIIIETNFGWPDVVNNQITSGPLFGQEELLLHVITKVKPNND